MPLFKLMKSNSFDWIHLEWRDRAGKKNSMYVKNNAKRISLFIYFLDLILIQFWRPKWKVNSISAEAGYQLANTQSALARGQTLIDF